MKKPKNNPIQLAVHAIAITAADLAQAHEALQAARREYRDFLHEATDGGESRLCERAGKAVRGEDLVMHGFGDVYVECWPRPVLEPEHWCESCRSVRPWLLAVKWWQKERARLYSKLIRNANKLRKA